MKKELLIIGGGFAGFWSAMSAIRQSREIKKQDHLNITMINPDNNVTIRPPQNKLSYEGLSFSMNRYLQPLGIHQIIGRVKEIFPEDNKVYVSKKDTEHMMTYDYLILATGAVLNLPKIEGMEYSYKVDSFINTVKLENHLIDLVKEGYNRKGANTIVVVGSEVMGLETVIGIEQKVEAIQMYYSGIKNPIQIVLLEEEKELASKFPEQCRNYIQNMISLRNIEVIYHSKVEKINLETIFLTNGNHINTKTVIWTKGLEASSLTGFFKGHKDTFNRLHVNAFLKLANYNNVIAAGNVCNSSENLSKNLLWDCQYAQFEGRWAGHNAINDLFNIPLKKYISMEHISCIDLGEPPILFTNSSNAEIERNMYNQLSRERYINSTTMFPWQDVEATVKASYPEFTIRN